VKPERRRAQLRPRARGARAFGENLPGGRQYIVLDTCVYIHNAAGRLPGAAQTIVDNAVQFHSAVCLGEIAAGLGNADPGARRYRATIAHYTALIAKIPSTRVLVPDDDVWARAGLIAGTRSASLEEAFLQVTHDALDFTQEHT